MKTVFAKMALVAAVATPFGVLRADDEQQGDDKKQEKRVEVKVLRLDGKDAGKPELKVYRVEPGDEREIQVIVGEPGGKAALRAFVADSGEKPAGKQPYLGVAIEPVPPALVAHLPGLLSKDQGLLVAEVAGDSPAAKAGLKEHDILVSYDDQKLFSNEQLTKLVRGDKPGREVTLGVVRAGKLEKVKATIGEHEAKTALVELLGKDGHFVLPGKDGRIVVEPLGEPREALKRILKERGLDDKLAPGAKVGVQTKSNFSSMRLESLDGDRFKAEIEFKNEKGDSLKRSFEGTRDEIRKQIDADKEMPDAIRHQMLRSFDFGKGGKGAYHFNMPRGGLWIDTDFGDFPAFNWPAGKDLEQIIEQLSEKLDPETREKLKGVIRKIEQPKKAEDRERSL